MKNAKSIRAQLYNLSKEKQIDFQVMITRYLHESVLSRIAESRWRDCFFLKGGGLMYAIHGLSSRPTIDIDLLGKNITNDANGLMHIFTEILKIKTADVVVFDMNSVEAKIINEKNSYTGIRISVSAGFDTIRQVLQIDIGFGDVVVPMPIKITYPVLLTDAKAPIINAYTTETVIAEKLQAIIVLAQLNSRMKDFYDIYTLLTTQPIDKTILKEAINQTFTQRNTPIPFDSVVFTAEFYTDSTRLRMWNTFLRKINVPLLDFATVIRTIKSKIDTINL